MFRIIRMFRRSEKWGKILKKKNRRKEKNRQRRVRVCEQSERRNDIFEPSNERILFLLSCGREFHCVDCAG